MIYFPACPPAEVMAPTSVPLSALVPGDPQGDTLRVPCHTFRDCPTPTRFRLGAYMANPPGDYYVAVYGDTAHMMERFSRPVSLLTPYAGL